MSDVLRRVMGMMAKRTYATWNPADKNAAVTLSGGNLVAACTATGATVRATVGKSSGQWYWEVTLSGAGYWFLGVANTTQSLNSQLWTPNSTGVQSNDYYYNSSTTGPGTGYTLVSGDVIGFGLDADAKTLKMYQNNVLRITIGAVQAGAVYPAVSGYNGTEVYTANFGATPFNYTPPVGYNPGVY